MGLGSRAGRSEGSPADSGRSLRLVPDHLEANHEGPPLGWSSNQFWAFSCALCILIAAVDAGLGQRVVLIGLLVAGPCCAQLTGRWKRTALTGVLAIGLAIALGIPDGILATPTHLVFLGAVLVVSLVTVAGAGLVERFAVSR